MTATATPAPHRTDAPAPRLGLWRRRVHPALLDRVMDTAEASAIRERVCAPLAGDVLEIGFGTGLNVGHLPPGVRRVLAVEPLDRAWERSHGRRGDGGPEVERIGVDAQELPLADGSVDAVLCTWSLCSIQDPVRSVREVARVLRPGGELHFVEHGLSEEARVQRWQRRGDPLWARIACGCHIDRDIPALLAAGGLRTTALRTYCTDSEPRFLGWTFEGRAEPTATT